VHGFAYFSTGVAAAAIVGAAISAPTFLRERELQQLRASCWSEMAQESFSILAASIVRNEVSTVAKNSGVKLSRADIVKATSIKASGFHTISVDETAHAATCGASVDFTFTKPDGKAVRNTGSIVQFQIYPSATGPVLTTMNVGLHHIVEAAQADD
jgi:hypothetical protein